MRGFTALTIDSKTGMRMIYSDCSYNMACFQLESETGMKPIDARMEGDMHRIEFEGGRVFYYDESRGYLIEAVAKERRAV